MVDSSNVMPNQWFILGFVIKIYGSGRLLPVSSTLKKSKPFFDCLSLISTSSKKQLSPFFAVITGDSILSYT